MIRLGRSGATYTGSTASLDAMRTKFDQENHVRLSDFLELEALDFIQRQIDGAEFYERVHEGIASNKELCMVGNAGFGALLLLVNDEKLFEIVETVTGCPRIRCFEGRVYRVSPGEGHHDSWHNDIGDGRLIGMSVNLSRERYGGGVLQLRDRASGKIVSEISNERPGDAVIFRLSDTLQHRITEVEGSAAKTAFAGWFKAQPDFLSLLRQQSERGRAAQLVSASSTLTLDPARFTPEPVC